MNPNIINIVMIEVVLLLHYYGYGIIYLKDEYLRNAL